MSDTRLRHLDWREGRTSVLVAWRDDRRAAASKRVGIERMAGRERALSPRPFADLLVSIAREAA